MLYRLFDHFRNNPILSALASEGIRYHDSNETPRNSLVERGPKLTQKMESIIKRGVAEGLFNDELKPNYVFSAAVLLIFGPYTQRYVIESLAGLDFNEEKTIKHWQEFSADIIIAAISRRQPTIEQ